MTDLTKMSVPRLLAMCDEYNYPSVADELARRLAAAEAIIAKLPKTADGVVVLPGSQVCLRTVGPRGGITYEMVEVGSDHSAGRWWVDDDCNTIGAEWETVGSMSECYSTREAAEKAKEQGND